MAAAPSVTFESLKSQLAKRQYAPIYLLHGEEGYYIDALVKIFEQILPPEERDFNMYTMYAPEVSPDTVMDACRRYPMMSEYQVVILKEAQAIRADQLNRLHLYASQPSPSTILVICCRGAVAKAKDLIAQIKKNNGVVFLSEKIKEYNAINYISSYIKIKGLNAEQKSLEMLRDYIGTDLSRLYNEIDKLALILGKNAMITPESIERNIGVSKDYNNFELIDALSQKDALKAFNIIEYFRLNPKSNPVVLTASSIFGYFSDLLMLYFTKDKSEANLMWLVGAKWPVQFAKFRNGMKNYNAYQVIEIIAAIREFDAKCKGIDSRQNEYMLLKDLVFHILSAPGDISF
ncbi:MAG: DNA polymerase III subunit delta [Muribaculaceae bacterium]|nr:DNA polymerase III subunit delta [Muribaculaceae bacterium]